MAIVNNADVARRVRGIAAEARIRQSELADELGLSRMSMNRRMNGATPFTPEELLRLATRLGVPVSELFEEASKTPGTVSDANLTRPADDVVGTASSATPPRDAG
jgi:transcriptional regulator with XRE-family HTH domain